MWEAGNPLIVAVLLLLISCEGDDIAPPLSWSDVPERTLSLALVGISFALVAGITLGVVAALRPYSPIDNASTLAALFGISLPGFWVGLMLIYLFSVQLRLLPTLGLTTPQHFILPGLMSLGALLTADAPLIWRLTFATAGIVGMIAVVTGSRGVKEPTGVIAALGRYEWLALPLYLIITLVAIDPDVVKTATALMPLQVEGAVMTLLVGLGIVFAWALFTEPQSAGASPEA